MELNCKMMDPVMAQRSVHEQQMVVLSRELHTSLMGGGGGGGRDGSSRGGAGGGGGNGGVGGSSEIEELTVDLTPYMNTSTFIVSGKSVILNKIILQRTR